MRSPPQPQTPPPLRRAMKFHFSHIGPITEAELELGDLTIVAGRNNTGKTYLVYTLYGFLKNWVWWKRSLNPGELLHTLVTIDVEQVATKLVEEGIFKFPISTSQLEKDRQNFISKLGLDNVAIADKFSSAVNNFENSSIKFDVDGDDLNNFLFEEGNFSIKYDGENLIFSTKPLGKVNFNPHGHLGLYIWRCYMRFLLGDQLLFPFILPAERLGIPLFYRELDLAKSRLVEALQNMGTSKRRVSISPFGFIGEYASRYALPIKDNIDYTRSLPDVVKQQSAMHGDRLYNDVKNIMGGEYKSDKNGIRFVSNARGDRRFDIPLHLASSSARELSDLYFYLRHTAQQNQLLIIDEPESHLDTQNQIMLARMLAHFVHSGIKVLITTHSDYVIKEVNNLVMLSNDFANKDKFVKKHQYSQNEFLHPNSLRCYVADKGRLTSCKVDKLGADVPLFDETIDGINKVSNDLFAHIEDAGDD